MYPSHDYSRGIGANGFAYNGGSDRAQQSRITYNARPDYAFLEQKGKSQNPYYPHVARDTPRHKSAHKGLLAFRILSPHALSNQDMAGGFSDAWGMDRDSVRYIDNVNGMLREGADTALVDLLDRIRVFGFIDKDLNAEPFRGAGDPLNNNIIASGVQTVPNTGPYTLRSGQTVMWDLPTVRQGKVYDSASDRIDNFEQGLAPLLTVPYVPSAHKGSSHLILNAMQNNKHDSHNEQALRRDGHVMIDSLKTIALMFIAIFVKPENDEINAKFLESAQLGSYDDGKTKRFIEALLAPTGQWISPKEAPNLNEISQYVPAKHERAPDRQDIGSLIGGIRGSDHTDLAHRGVPESATKTFNILQLRAFPQLYSAIASIESQYARRVIGQAITTADPGRDFDILLKMSPNGSL